MDEQRWRQVEALYHAALEREPPERSGYLLEACRGDEELWQEVESLLEQDVSRSGILDHPPWADDAGPLPSPSEEPPTHTQARQPEEASEIDGESVPSPKEPASLSLGRRPRGVDNDRGFPLRKLVADNRQVHVCQLRVE